MAKSKTSSRRACKTPDEFAADQQAQIPKLEKAIDILGENNPEAASLVVSLKKVRAKVSLPVGERLDACHQFVERARKRVVAAQEAVEKAVETKSRLDTELQEGLLRLQRFREEAAAQTQPADRPDGGMPDGGVPPTAPVGAAAEVNRLRSMVDELQRERDLLREEVSSQRAGKDPGNQSVLMSTLIDHGDTLRRGTISGGNRYNPLA